MRPHTERHDVETAVHDAIMVYIRNPSGYCKRKGSLLNWLTIVALNKARDIERVSRRLSRIEVHDHGQLLSTPAPLAGVHLGESVEDLEQHIRQVTQTPEERAFLRAKFRGERRSESLGTLIGAFGTTQADRQAQVHRMWMKLRARLIKQVKGE